MPSLGTAELHSSQWSLHSSQCMAVALPDRPASRHQLLHSCWGLLGRVLPVLFAPWVPRMLCRPAPLYLRLPSLSPLPCPPCRRPPGGSAGAAAAGAGLGDERAQEPGHDARQVLGGGGGSGGRAGPGALAAQRIVPMAGGALERWSRLPALGACLGVEGRAARQVLSSDASPASSAISSDPSPCCQKFRLPRWPAAGRRSAWSGPLSRAWPTWRSAE